MLSCPISDILVIMARVRKIRIQRGIDRWNTISRKRNINGNNIVLNFRVRVIKYMRNVVRLSRTLKWASVFERKYCLIKYIIPIEKDIVIL